MQTALLPHSWQAGQFCHARGYGKGAGKALAQQEAAAVKGQRLEMTSVSSNPTTPRGRIEMLPQVWQIPSVALLVGGVQWGCWILNDPVTIFVALWWGIPYALWTLNLLGGADVRIFMALVAFFPYPEMVAALWGGLALVSIIWLLVQYRRNALIPLVQAGQGMLGGQYPSRENLKKQGRPTTPGLVLGALVYMWSMMN
jgi:Flp pilus assembly protein protease CpaA